MVVIRLARRGAKKKPFYSMVVADSRRARDGRYIERVGHYNPLQPDILEVNRERIDFWVANGAKCSPVVARLVKKFDANAKNITPSAADNTPEATTTTETNETQAVTDSIDASETPTATSEEASQ